MNLHKLLFSAVILITSALFLLNTSIASAKDYDFATDSGLKQTSTGAGYDTASSTQLTGYVSQIISVILSVLGVIFLAFTIYGGIIWMTAAGNEERVKKAKELIIESVIGVIIVIVAYAISYFILSATTNPTLKTNTSVIAQLDVK